MVHLSKRWDVFRNLRTIEYIHVFTLPETNIAPEEWWETTFLLGRPIFRGYVGFKECNAYNLELAVLPEPWFTVGI